MTNARNLLLVAERFGGIDARRTSSGPERGQDGGDDDGGDDGGQVEPRDAEGDADVAGLGADVGDDVVGDEEPEAGAGSDGRDGDDARLCDQRAADHSWLEADGAQHAQLLAPLDDGSCGDDAEGGDADDEPEPHEALDDADERHARSNGFVEDVLV